MKMEKLSEQIFLLKDFWSVEKCIALIERSEQIGYEQALIDGDNGQVLAEEVRNNQRILFTDIALRDQIWSEVKEFAPQKIGNSIAIGLNEMFRFYKYQPGQLFKKHRDQSFMRNESEASYYTLLIYLNNEFEGGTTTFNNITINPKTGACLIFLHDLEHEGAIITEGVKYVLRTDIMYQFQNP